MKHLLLLFIFVSTVLIGQRESALQKIDADYQSYLNNIFNPTFHTDQKNERKKVDLAFFYLGNHLDTLVVNKTTSFGIGDPADTKMMAAILYGLKYHASYKYMLDGYEQKASTTAFKMKEMAEVLIHFIPDTNQMQVIHTQHIGEGRFSNQYAVAGMIHLEKPIQIMVYKDYNERNNQNYIWRKIQIFQNGKLWMSNKTRNETNEVMINNKSYDNWGVYHSKGFRFLIQGGLFNKYLIEALNELTHKANMQGRTIKNTTDYYQDSKKDLTRMLSFGSFKAVSDWRFTL